MSLKAVYPTIDEVPQAFRELYTEKEGKVVLTGVEGVKPEEEFTKVYTALTKERNEHKATKGKLQLFGDLSPDDVHQKLDRFAELEILAQGGSGQEIEKKVGALLNAKLKTQLMPIERERDTFKTKAAEYEQQVLQFSQRETKRIIHDQIRAAAQKVGLAPTAVEDALLLGETQLEVVEGKVITKETALTPDLWLESQKNVRPHWWPNSVTAGARGGTGMSAGGNNPWSRQHWNLTAQGQFSRANGLEKASQMAQMAGSSVGATTPPEK